MSQSRPLAQLRARRFAQTAQSALFIAGLIAVSSLALPLAGENARTGPYPSGSLSAPYQLPTSSTGPRFFKSGGRAEAFRPENTRLCRLFPDPLLFFSCAWH